MESCVVIRRYLVPSWAVVTSCAPWLRGSLPAGKRTATSRVKGKQKTLWLPMRPVSGLTLRTWVRISLRRNGLRLWHGRIENQKCCSRGWTRLRLWGFIFICSLLRVPRRDIVCARLANATAPTPRPSSFPDSNILVEMTLYSPAARRKSVRSGAAKEPM